MLKQFETKEGICVGHDGPVDIASVQVCVPEAMPDTIMLDGIGKFGGYRVAGGIRCDRACALALAKHIIEVLGHDEKV